MPDFINAFEVLLIELRRRGFKTDNTYISYLFQDLQAYPNRANMMFNFYGVIR